MEKTPHRPAVVAFTGLARSGKTTAAQFLRNRNYDKMSFADPIKQMVRCITPVADKDFAPPACGGKTLRELYQTLGTDWGRNMVNPDIWVQLGREKIESLLLDMTDHVIAGVVIDDLRFDNEALLVKSLGGLVIQIECSGVAQMEHESEAGIAPHLVDYVIVNDTSFDDLRETVLAICGLAPPLP
jgi:hypothetical protein